MKGILLSLAVMSLLPALVSAGDFRNWFGPTWNAPYTTAQQYMKYAHQMGYDYVMYNDYTRATEEYDYTEMRNVPDMYKQNKKFYIDDPQYRGFPDGVSIWVYNGKNYSPSEKAAIESFASWVDNDAFPNNLWSYWYDSVIDANCLVPDLQQQAVQDQMINKIINYTESLEEPGINFTFGGYFWDVAGYTITDDPSQGWFPALHEIRGGTYKTSSTHLHSGITHDYSSYYEGLMAFQKRLHSEMLSRWPNAKFGAEPWDIYNHYIKYAEECSPHNYNDFRMDMLFQEGNSNKNFATDSRIWNSGLIDKSHCGVVGSDICSEYDNRDFAGTAAVNGQWFGWFGHLQRYGGSCPNLDLETIPMTFKLGRCIPNWDNEVGVPLSDRSYSGGIYQSPNSFMSSSIQYSRHWKTGKIFAVWGSTSGKIALNAGETVTSVMRTDGLFLETTDGSSDVTISGNEISLNSLSNIGRGYIITVLEGSEYECSDSIDNDGDSRTDFPYDTGCSSLTDNDETNCGDGVCEGGEACDACIPDCGTCPEPDLCSGLVLLHQYDGDAQDTSGLSNHGTVNGAAYTPSGKFEGAYSFDGQEDSINAGSDPSLRPADAVTACAWVKLEGDGSSSYPQIVGGSGGDGYELDYNADDDTFEFWVYDGEWGTPATSLNTYTSTGWVHLCGVYDKAAPKLYLDGVRQNDGSNTGSIVYRATEILVGAGDSGENFNGTIDEVAVWNRTLSGQEIQDIFSSDLPLSCQRQSIHSCDTDPQDGCVSMPELTSFIDSWHYDSTANPMWELMKAVSLYYNPEAWC